MSTLRDHAGGARAPLTPIAAAKQREALKIIESGLFSADSFRFKPEFMRRMQVDYLDRNDVYGVGLSTPGVDYSLTGQVLAIQRTVLDNLMSETIAQRILDSEVKLDDPKTGFHLSELYESLHRSIWSGPGSSHASRGRTGGTVGDPCTSPKAGPTSGLS